MPRRSNRRYSNRAPRTAAAKKRAATAPYAPRNRLPMRRQLQPFVETKSLVATATDQFLNDSDAFTIITPNCYLYKKAGDADGQMVGQSCYSRFLTTKLRMKFPQAENQIVIPTQIYIYKLWIHAPIAATPYTSPARSTISKAQVEEHIANQCKEFFNAISDRMQFKEKMEGVTVLQKVLVRTKRQSSISLPTVDTTTDSSHAGTLTKTLGGPPDFFMSFKWPCKQKLHYEPSTNLGLVYDLYLNRPPSGGRSPGYPAIVIFNPDFAGQNTGTWPGGEAFDRRIAYEHNSKHWYGDM